MIRDVFDKAVASPPGSRFTIPPDYTASMLTTAYALCRVRPDLVFVVARWPNSELTADAWLAWFRHKLDIKILSHDPRRQPETPRSDDYNQALVWLRPYIGTRIVLHHVDTILGKRVIRALRDRFGDERDYVRLYAVANNRHKYPNHRVIGARHGEVSREP